MNLHTKYGKTKLYDQPLYMNPRSTEEVFPVKAIDDSGIFTLNNGKYSKSFVLSDITINYERVADHCSNLAVDLLRIHENVFDVHEYLEGLKENKDAAFREAYQKDKAVYALPQS